MGAKEALEKIYAARDYVQKKFDFQADMAIVLGSGLDIEAENYEVLEVIPYQDIPYFKTSTAPGHQGKLLLAKLGEHTLYVLHGRLHYYEGYESDDIAFPIRLLGALGVKKLILTNAAGGINTEFKPGQLMLIKDHINFSGFNPLIGENLSELGPRFPDMSFAYDQEFIDSALAIGKNLGIDLKEGIYLSTSGPSYETPAEIRAFRILGADAVGMSTVPEVIIANHMGMRVLALSCISNMAAGVLNQRLTEEEVLETGKGIRKDFSRFISEVICNIGGLPNGYDG